MDEELIADSRSCAPSVLEGDDGDKKGADSGGLAIDCGASRKKRYRLSGMLSCCMLGYEVCGCWVVVCCWD